MPNYTPHLQSYARLKKAFFFHTLHLFLKKAPNLAARIFYKKRFFYYVQYRPRDKLPLCRLLPFVEIKVSRKIVRGIKLPFRSAFVLGWI